MVVREDEPLARGKSSGAAAACGEDANGSAAKLLEIFGGEAHPVALRQTIRRQPIQTPHPLLTEKMPAHHDRKDVDQDALHHQQILGQRHTGNQTRSQATASKAVEGSAARPRSAPNFSGPSDPNAPRVYR